MERDDSHKASVGNWILIVQLVFCQLIERSRLTFPLVLHLYSRVRPIGSWVITGLWPSDSATRNHWKCPQLHGLSSSASTSILFHRTFSIQIKQFLFNLKSLFLQVIYHVDGNRRENYDDRVLKTTVAWNLTLRRLMSYIYIYIYIWSTHSCCF